MVPALPAIGILVNLGLMAILSAVTWSAFLSWMAIGLIVYVLYSRRHSLARAS
jgi:APA family basic amino acid/polyamine antiporter